MTYRSPLCLVVLSAPAVAGNLNRERVKAKIETLRTRPLKLLTGGHTALIELPGGEKVVVERTLETLGRRRASTDSNYRWTVHGIAADRRFGQTRLVQVLNAKQRRQIKAILSPHLKNDDLVVNIVPTSEVIEARDELKEEQRRESMTPNERAIEDLKRSTSLTEHRAPLHHSRTFNHDERDERYEETKPLVRNFSRN
jgi:hypothetical protein